MSVSKYMSTTKHIGGVDIEGQETRNTSQSATLSTTLLQSLLLNYKQPSTFIKEVGNVYNARTSMDKEDESKELSGMMLCHCLLYKNIFFDAKSSKNSYLAFDQQEPQFIHNRPDPCLLFSKITASSVKTSTAYCKIISWLLIFKRT